ncbi:MULTISPECIES: c-type cytochrome [Pedobacter]|uniref:Cytochrome c class I n=1 Tax=Pedobacter heparinus (strain ATCC 13125 / DSM 2366 / CIP 104194 / JCM 7457 / NBRC 12017 / NCIMB 9290 / NRRL B-14731 / HIM 762-3) TaxID=485917 RepID=C6XZX9_PEDHD|nr:MULTISPECIES: cytochrome c [Pedobacter]ACU02674.1 cytochrome c class I [Pedobacter heparinus DSM 2366]MBB5439835.1 mono/diheme cytochrome c family protein [Pedobacter sp. AK017]
MKKILLTLLILSAAGLQLSAQTKGKKTTAAKPQMATAAVMANGKKIYNKYCLACHMADGAGVPNMNPPLSKTSYVLGDKTRLIKVILNGLATGEEIDGETYTNVMPAHNFLTDQEIADVLSFVRNSFENKAAAISMQEVKAIRAKNTKK